MSYLLNDAQDPRSPKFLSNAMRSYNDGSGIAYQLGDISLESATPQALNILDGEDVLAERGKQWGDAYKQISGDWAELLGVHTTTEQFIAMMIVLKLRRWRNSGYQEKDCLTDIIGYAKLGLS